MLADLRLPRDAGEQRLHDVRAVVLGRIDVEQQVHHMRQLGVEHELAVQRRVLARLGLVEVILLTERDHQLVHQRVAKAAHLHVAVP